MCRASTQAGEARARSPWMPADQVRGLKAHGSRPAKTRGRILRFRLSTSWIEATVTKVTKISSRFSKSLARRRFRTNQDKPRSTIQRLGTLAVAEYVGDHRARPNVVAGQITPGVAGARHRKWRLSPAACRSCAVARPAPPRGSAVPARVRIAARRDGQSRNLESCNGCNAIQSWVRLSSPQ